jgi:hypothetical protein
VLGADAKLSRHRPFSGDRFKLAALFALDSFAGGFVMQTFAAYWFHLRFGADPATLGLIFLGAKYSRRPQRLLGVPARLPIRPR